MASIIGKVSSEPLKSVSLTNEDAGVVVGSRFLFVPLALNWQKFLRSRLSLQIVWAY